MTPSSDCYLKKINNRMSRSSSYHLKKKWQRMSRSFGCQRSFKSQPDEGVIRFSWCCQCEPDGCSIRLSIFQIFF